MKNKVKYDCDCIYIIIDGCVYENDPYEDCKMCKGRGWYLGEKDEIQYSRKASYYNLCYSLYIFDVFNIKIRRKEMTLYNIFYIDETIGWTKYLVTTDNPKKWIEDNNNRRYKIN